MYSLALLVVSSEFNWSEVVFDPVEVNQKAQKGMAAGWKGREEKRCCSLDAAFFMFSLDRRMCDEMAVVLYKHSKRGQGISGA